MLEIGAVPDQNGDITNLEVISSVYDPNSGTGVTANQDNGCTLVDGTEEAWGSYNGDGGLAALSYYDVSEHAFF